MNHISDYCVLNKSFESLLSSKPSNDLFSLQRLIITALCNNFEHLRLAWQYIDRSFVRWKMSAPH